jgi:hypothetical protein
MNDCSMNHPLSYTLGDSIHKQALTPAARMGSVEYSSMSECGCGGNCSCGKKLTPLS